jgi:hypothetical protein
MSETCQSSPSTRSASRTLAFPDKRTAGTIMKNATKIELDCDRVGTSIERLLRQALTALDGCVFH